MTARRHVRLSALLEPTLPLTYAVCSLRTPDSPGPLADGAEACPVVGTVRTMAAPLTPAEVQTPCGREHTSCKKKKGGTGAEYKLFSAAADGCLKCVRYYVEVEQIPYDATSESGQYTALIHAEWAATQDVNTADVRRYLKEQQSARKAGSVNTTQGLVPGLCDPKRHAYDDEGSTVTDMDMFHGAAYDGCMQCAKFWVKERHLSPLLPENGYSALQWALYGAEQAAQQENLHKVGRCSEVAGYLDAVAPSTVPHGRTSVAASSSPPLPTFNAVPPPPPPVEQEPAPRPSCHATDRSSTLGNPAAGRGRGGRRGAK